MALRRVASVAALLLATALVVAMGSTVGTDQQSSPGPKDVRLVDVGMGEDRLWPYTSREADFDSRTLAINLIVYENPDSVRYRLERHTPLTWQEENVSEGTGNFSVDLTESHVGFVWSPAYGSLRYTYVERDGVGRWLPQRYQLHAGTYLGSRSHVRAYAPGGDSGWTALQAHSEYWDWFRLRHSVTDVWDIGRLLEADFADQPLVSGVERIHGTERGPTSGGISIVHVATVLLVASLVPVRRRVADAVDDVAVATPTSRRSLALFAVSLAVPLAIRGAGIGLELGFPWLPPKVIAAPLYVVLVAGLPVGVYRLSDRVPASRAGLLAPMGFLLGSTLDYLALGVTGVPPRYVWHRLVLAGGLGIIAAGSRERGLPRTVLVAGFAVWSGAVLAAALGFV